MRKISILAILFAAVFFVPIALQADTWVSNFLRAPDGSLKVSCRTTPAAGDKWVSGFMRDSAGDLLIANCASTAAPTPTPTTPATPNNPGTHVNSVVYGWGYNGVSLNVSIATQAQYVTYAYQGNYTSQYKTGGIFTIKYLNGNLCYPTDNPRTCYYELAPIGVCQSNAAANGYNSANCIGTYTSQEAKNCSGTPVYDAHYGNGYLNAPYISTTNYTQIFVDQAGTIAQDYVFSDDTASNGGLTNGAPCNTGTSYDGPTWVTQEQTVTGALSVLGKPLFLNLLNAYVVNLFPPDLVPVSQNTDVAGAMCENCFVKSGGVIDSLSDWQNDETALMTVISNGKLAWVYSNMGAITAANSAALRTYAYASFLLSYNKPYSIFQYALSGLTDTMPVMPEEQLVPTNPLITGSTVSDYARGGGYFRAWTDCFWKGNDIGPCAVAINPNASGNMTVPTSGYSHSLSIPAGNATSDIVGGGTVSLTGSVSSTLTPQTAEVLLP